MALNEKIGPYYNSTEEFVEELSGYLKIAKVCDNEHLVDCFNYDEIKINKSEPVKIEDIQNGVTFAMNDTNYKDTMGIVTLDGTSMVLSWKTNCEQLEPGVYEWGGDTNKTTSCIAAVMDVNGDKKPNTLNKDVALFNARALGNTCMIRLEEENICWMAPVVVNQFLDLTDSDTCDRMVELGVDRKSCNKITQAEYDNNEGDIRKNGNLYADKDYWAKAVEICGGTKNMPTSQDIVKIVDHVYSGTTGSEVYSKKWNWVPATLDTNALATYGLNWNGSSLILWTGEQYSSNISLAGYLNMQGSQVLLSTTGYRGYSGRYAICLGES